MLQSALEQQYVNEDIHLSQLGSTIGPTEARPNERELYSLEAVTAGVDGFDLTMRLHKSQQLLIIGW